MCFSRPNIQMPAPPPAPPEIKTQAKKSPVSYETLQAAARRARTNTAGAQRQTLLGSAPSQSQLQRVTLLGE